MLRNFDNAHAELTGEPFLFSPKHVEMARQDRLNKLAPLPPAELRLRQWRKEREEAEEKRFAAARLVN
jgi:hypothetical protein